jgi:hypothetical protein
VPKALITETRAQDLPFQSTKDGGRGVDMSVLDRWAIGVDWKVFRVGLEGISGPLPSRGRGTGIGR